MEKRRLGSQGLETSALGFGCMGLSWAYYGSGNAAERSAPASAIRVRALRGAPRLNMCLAPLPCERQLEPSASLDSRIRPAAAVTTAIGCRSPRPMRAGRTTRSG